MITSLRLVNFKNFADETLRIGPFTVIVGANASGKSNIRDAFRFLHGIGRGYTLAEIMGGKYGSGGQIVWEPIRGSMKEITRFGKAKFSFDVTLKLSGGGFAFYGIEVESDKEGGSDFRIGREELRVGNNTIFTSHPPAPDPVRQQDDEAHLLLRMAKTGSQRKYGNRITVLPNRPALTQLRNANRVIRAHREYARQVSDLLGHFRFLDPTPDLMRKPSFPGQKVLGDSGENLSTVLQKICADQERKGIFSEWIRELTPMDVEDFEFPDDPTTGLVQLLIHETNGRRISAYSASDGTLRFLAMLAALLDEDPAQLYVFEEVDNGIHPARLHLLVDLIERQTAKNVVQVVTTTHSPELLSMVSDKTFRHMSVICRLESTDDAVIRPISGLRNAGELRKSQGLGQLLAGGWMEDTLAFSATGGEEARE